MKDDVMIGEGWNSPPKGSHQNDCIRCSGDFKSGEHLELAMCVHAEANAIGYCARKGHSTEGAIMYCTHFCCKYCADLIISAGIKEYVYIQSYAMDDHAKDILNKANVKIRKLEIDNE